MEMYIFYMCSCFVYFHCSSLRNSSQRFHSNTWTDLCPDTALEVDATSLAKRERECVWTDARGKM